jgi:CRISPR-associated Csx2 family protein
MNEETNHRKLFLSFLGTGFYEECVYYDESREFSPTRFIQAATLEQINAKDWSENDAIRIFTTKEAYDDNWDKGRTTRLNPRKKEDGEQPYERLEQRIENMHLKADVKAVTNVPLGQDENEIWQIFQMVSDEIQDFDELYIDLTHAFRYLPMLMLVVSNYAKFIKGAKVCHLSYGNWEKHKSDGGVQKAPIVNLLPLTELQNWTTAVADFIRYGQVEALDAATIHELRPLLANEETRNEDVINVKNYVKTLKLFVEQRQTCRGVDIDDDTTVKKLVEYSEMIKDTGIKPLNPVFTKLKDAIKVPDSELKRVVDAAEWCFNKHLYQQCLTILLEGLVTFFCKRHKMDCMKASERGLVNSAFYCCSSKEKNGKSARLSWRVAVADMPKIRELISDPLINDPEICGAFASITKLRNNYNHAGYEIDSSSDIKTTKIEENIEKIRLYLLPHIGEEVVPTQPAAKKIFINLSNHPLKKWSDEQLEAAKKYGEVIDMEFPQIDAKADTKQVKELAREYAQRIIDKYDDGDTEITVHVMGEMTFLYNFVSKFQGCGFRCVASSTKRIVKEIGPDKKLTEFHFEGFREY